MFDAWWAKMVWYMELNAQNWHWRDYVNDEW